MNFGRCPTCHTHLDLAALVEDEAGRELLATVARLSSRVAGPMLAYLGLWRPAKQDLRNSRALAILQDTLTLTSDTYLLAAALEQTVQQLQQQRQRGDWRPLKSSGYLKQVLAGITERVGQPTAATTSSTSAPAMTTNERHESPEENERKWRRQMIAMGVRISPDGRIIRED